MKFNKRFEMAAVLVFMILFLCEQILLLIEQLQGKSTERGTSQGIS